MFNLTTIKFIQEQCQKLQQRGLCNFTHDITFSDGQISMLSSSNEVLLFYKNNKIPTLCTDSTGRTLAPGIYLNRTLENSRKDCAFLMPLLVNIGNQFGLNYGKNSLHIVSRENDCQHLYSLFFDMEEDAFIHWVLNNGELMNDFVHAYNHTAKDIILETKAPENRIILPTSEEFTHIFHLENSENLPTLKVIHKHLHMPIHLSPQQSKCLLLLMKGKSAKEIASKMKLSRRTIEHYIEKLRKQLGCGTTKELIAFYSEQLRQQEF